MLFLRSRRHAGRWPLSQPYKAIVTSANPAPGFNIAGTHQITVELLTPQGFGVTPSTIVFSSRNTGVATVHATSGLVTGVGAGSTQIVVTLTFGSKSFTRYVTITVFDPQVPTAVVVSPTSISIAVGQSAQIAVHVVDTQGSPLTGRTINAVSADPSKVSVTLSQIVEPIHYFTAVGEAEVSLLDPGLTFTDPDA